MKQATFIALWLSIFAHCVQARMTSHFPNKTESQIRRQETPPSSPIKYTNIANSTEGQYEEYCIFPRNGKNRDECLETAAFFIEILQLDYIFNYTSKYDGLLFWTAFLTPELFEDVSSYVGVSSPLYLLIFSLSRMKAHCQHVSTGEQRSLEKHFLSVNLPGSFCLQLRGCFQLSRPQNFCYPLAEWANRFEGLTRIAK